MSSFSKAADETRSAGSAARHPANADEAFTLLLHALAWTVSSDTRAERFLALTGLGGAELRASASNPSTLNAVVQFLADYEPDMIACAEALDVPPTAFRAAARLLRS